MEFAGNYHISNVVFAKMKYFVDNITGDNDSASDNKNLYLRTHQNVKSFLHSNSHLA